MAAIALAVTAVLASGRPVSGQTPATTPAPEVRPPLDTTGITRRLDAYLKRFADAGDFSGIALIAHRNTILASAHYGLASREFQVPAADNTLFRIASVSKTFTAGAILMLVERGQIQLNDRLSKFIPTFPHAGEITIEQLLSHEAGIGVLDDESLWFRDETLQSIVAQIGRKPLLFAPGTRSQYSSEGYTLLAYVIQIVSKMPFQQFLNANILVPLQLQHTLDAAPGLVVDQLAEGYVPGIDEDSAERVLPFLLTHKVGAGSLLSNGSDLLRWLEAVNEHTLFNLSRYEYPFGWGKRHYFGRDIWEQSGAELGFNTFVAIYPDDSLYFVVASNLSSGFAGTVDQDLPGLLFGRVPAEPLTPRYTYIAASMLGDYTGQYRSSQFPLQTIAARRGHLYMKWADTPFERILVPIGTDEFFYRPDYATVTFRRDSTGRVASAIWHWPSGFDLTVVRNGAPH